jgi:hypothetical protein
MFVIWRCPAINCRYSTGLRLNAVQHGRSVAMMMEPDDEDKMREHIKSHIAVIKESWRSLESALGVLGYAMDVTVSPGVDPDVQPVKDDEPICRCEHAISLHRDQRDEWTACLKQGCGCLGYSEDDPITQHGDDPHGGDFPW